MTATGQLKVGITFNAITFTFFYIYQSVSVADAFFSIQFGAGDISCSAGGKSRGRLHIKPSIVKHHLGSLVKISWTECNEY
ncbi:hypothetical protein [Veronia pacifica]|uniref:hypothetical protein n=1 Tax=Veronia pacifica TaxID=1080227 RepID=UPI001112F214|nr:hypothetical protein [Veronia pacifica]